MLLNKCVFRCYLYTGTHRHMHIQSLKSSAFNVLSFSFNFSIFKAFSVNQYLEQYTKHRHIHKETVEKTDKTNWVLFFLPLCITKDFLLLLLSSLQLAPPKETRWLVAIIARPFFYSFAGTKQERIYYHYQRRLRCRYCFLNTTINKTIRHRKRVETRL